MILYSNTVTDCMESWQESLHLTKKGAWKAGNAWLNKQHNKGYESRQLIPKDINDFMSCFYSFRVVAVEVLD